MLHSFGYKHPSPNLVCARSLTQTIVDTHSLVFILKLLISLALMLLLVAFLLSL
jgi:hypothetical protein